jgi:hypothetical protein
LLHVIPQINSSPHEREAIAGRELEYNL